MIAAQPTRRPIGYHSSAGLLALRRGDRARQQREIAQDRDRQSDGAGEDGAGGGPEHAADHERAGERGDRRRCPAPAEPGEADRQGREVEQDAGKRGRRSPPRRTEPRKRGPRRHR